MTRIDLFAAWAKTRRLFTILVLAGLAANAGCPNSNCPV